MTESSCTECKGRIEHVYVQLPPEKWSKCDVCGSTPKSPKLCSRCGERIYCSEQCGTRDWSSHKLACGKTSRIALESFHPFLAIMADAARHRRFLACGFTPQGRPELTYVPGETHFALTGTIANNANPSPAAFTFPDGYEARLVVVDDTVEHTPLRGIVDPLGWFPQALDKKVATKLWSRIAREGNALPVTMAVALTILSEMYTTTSAAKSPAKRVRLKYRTSPIADFGLIRGSVIVEPHNRLAYLRKSTPAKYTRGQDPDEHYWLYFTTLRGEDVILDFNLFAHNFALTVPIDAYVDGIGGSGRFDAPYAPAYFEERIVRANTSRWHTEHKRMSVLRNEGLHEAIKHMKEGLGGGDLDIVKAFMANLAERSISDVEMDMMSSSTSYVADLLAKNLRDERWQRYPDYPTVAILDDPGAKDYSKIKTPKFKSRSGKGGVE